MDECAAVYAQSDAWHRERHCLPGQGSLTFYFSSGRHTHRQLSTLIFDVPNATIMVILFSAVLGVFLWAVDLTLDRAVLFFFQRFAR